MNPPSALVVDIGSAAISACLVDDGGARLLTEPGGTAHRWPSSACPDGDAVLLGTAAERRKRAAPRAYVPDVRGAEAALIGAVLGALRAELERAATAVPDRLVLTVPVAWPPGHPGRARLLAAGAAARFPDVELLPDAVAAAFDEETLPAAAHTLVCDIGATGTVALVRRTPAGGEVVDHVPVPGGVELDRALRRAIWPQIAPYVGPMTAAPDDAGLRGRIEVDEFVTRLRHQLTDRPEAEDSLSPLAPPIRVDRSLFRAQSQDTIRLLRHAVETLGGGHGTSPVLLTGGAARTPDIGAALVDRGGAPTAVSSRPELSVVRGAARWATAVRRSLTAEPPARRVKPLIWTVPDGHASLLRWAVPEGDRFADGAVVASARTRDDTVVELVATRGGTLLRHRLAPGDEVADAIAAEARFDPRDGDDDADAARLVTDLMVRAVWLDRARDELVLVDTGAERDHLRVHRLPLALDQHYVRREVPVPASLPVSDLGIFRGPLGEPVLVARTLDSWFHVVDLTHGGSILSFRDRAFTFRVNEKTWDMITENDRGLPIGMRKYRNVTYSLVEGTAWRSQARLVGNKSHTAWSEQPDARDFRRPGDSRHSGFGPTATSRDGHVTATLRKGRIVVTSAGRKQKLSVPGRDEANRAVALSADGSHVVTAERDGRTQVRMWLL